MAEFKKINIDGQDLDIHAKFADMDANGKAVDSYVAGATLTGTDLNLYDGNALPVGSPIDLSGIGGSSGLYLISILIAYNRDTSLYDVISIDCTDPNANILTWNDVLSYYNNTNYLLIVREGGNHVIPCIAQNGGRLLLGFSTLDFGFGNVLQSNMTYVGSFLLTDNIIGSAIENYDSDIVCASFNVTLPSAISAGSTTISEITLYGKSVNSIPMVTMNTVIKDLFFRFVTTNTAYGWSYDLFKVIAIRTQRISNTNYLIFEIMGVNNNNPSVISLRVDLSQSNSLNKQYPMIVISS